MSGYLRLTHISETQSLKSNTNYCMKRLPVLLLLLAAALSFSACKKLVSKAIEEGVKQTNSKGSSENDMAIDKLNAYVGVINRTSSDFARSYKSYAKWASDGITGKEKYPNFSTVSDPKSEIEKLKKALDAEPKYPELDEIGKRYVAAVEALYPKLQEAGKYYDQKDYKDDKFAKAKTMHDGLMQGYKEFEKVDNELHAAYEKVDEAQAEKNIAAMKENKQELRYRTAMNTKQAKKTLNVIIAEYDKVDNVSKMNIEPVKAETEKLEAAIEDVRKYMKENPEAAKTEFGATGESGVNSYLSDADAFLKASKELYRKVRDKESFKSVLSANMVEGTPEYALEKYNRMIRSSNSWLNR
jgi:hypothetical protein